VAVTSGRRARRSCSPKSGTASALSFHEVMACPGGCITGGGQPRSEDPDVGRKRMEALYGRRGQTASQVPENPDLIALYRDYLGKPLGHVSHELLHTVYTKRGKVLTRTGQTLSGTAGSHRGSRFLYRKFPVFLCGSFRGCIYRLSKTYWEGKKDEHEGSGPDVYGAGFYADPGRHGHFAGAD
jgi:hypothetical protein